MLSGILEKVGLRTPDAPLSKILNSERAERRYAVLAQKPRFVFIRQIIIYPSLLNLFQSEFHLFQRIQFRLASLRLNQTPIEFGHSKCSKFWTSFELPLRACSEKIKFSFGLRSQSVFQLISEFAVAKR